MAAAKKHRRKVRNKESFFFSFFGSCFGISNRVSADHNTDPKSLKIAKSTSARPLPAPPKTVKDHDHGEKRDEIILAPSAHELMTNKDINITCSVKGVEKEDSTIPRSERWAKSTKLSHSVSLPLLCRGKEESGPNEKGKERKLPGELEPMVGAVIIMVTLIVMVIWGKVCAILCTASWFYFLPRFRANLDEYYAIELKNDAQNHFLDLDSKEYKKMVVLQGLLDR